MDDFADIAMPALSVILAVITAKRTYIIRKTLTVHMEMLTEMLLGVKIS